MAPVTPTAPADASATPPPPTMALRRSTFPGVAAPRSLTMPQMSPWDWSAKEPPDTERNWPVLAFCKRHIAGKEVPSSVGSCASRKWMRHCGSWAEGDSHFSSLTVPSEPTQRQRWGCTPIRIHRSCGSSPSAACATCSLNSYAERRSFRRVASASAKSLSDAAQSPRSSLASARPLGMWTRPHLGSVMVSAQYRTKRNHHNTAHQLAWTGA
mmetsp:Transcript_1415/g.3848  ORF Transcript_1415/g.3848 Transcript_1415/m.3848 type:complete len:212 (-) Transcript_1415:3-638(-)